MHQHEIRRESHDAPTSCSRCGSTDVTLISGTSGDIGRPVAPFVWNCAACGTCWIETPTGRVWRIASDTDAARSRRRSRRATLGWCRRAAV